MMRRFISTKVHGVLDYIMGAGLIAAPFLLGFRKKSPEAIIPMAMGASAIMYSLCTDYEMGVIRGISMETHLEVDKVSGLLLAASPAIFGFRKTTFWPHLILGAVEVLTALSTKKDATPNNGPSIKEFLPDKMVEKLDGRRKVIV